MQEHRDVDCVFMNAGTQSQVNLAQPDKVDVPAFHAEIATNFSSFVDLSLKFLPFLLEKTTKTSLI